MSGYRKKKQLIGPSLEKKQWPSWLVPFLNHDFFHPCTVHGARCNVYCLDCVTAPFCTLCWASHHDRHTTITVIRTSSGDAVELFRMQFHLDVSLIQFDSRPADETLSSAAIVYLKKPVFGLGETPYDTSCLHCDTFIRMMFEFCSIACMVAELSEDDAQTDNNGEPPSYGRGVNSRI